MDFIQVTPGRRGILFGPQCLGAHQQELGPAWPGSGIVLSVKAQDKHGLRRLLLLVTMGDTLRVARLRTKVVRRGVGTLRARWVVHTGAIAAVLAVGVLSLAPGPAPTASVSTPFDCQPKPLSRIPPGTRIADVPPDGWTHLISKSQPELTTGDINKIHPRAAELARFLFSCLLARVDRQETANGTIYRLEEIGTGLGTRIGQDDVIIDSKTQSELGANLGFLERCVLRGAETELNEPVVLARSATSLIVDMPGIMLLDGKHRPVVLRYLFMVHPREGRLEAVLWRLDVDAQGVYQLADVPAVRRCLGRVQRCELHVDASETFAGIPKPSAFATTQLPPGDALPLPPSLHKIAGERQLTSDMAEQIDVAIRQAIGFLPEN